MHFIEFYISMGKIALEQKTVMIDCVLAIDFKPTLFPVSQRISHRIRIILE